MKKLLLLLLFAGLLNTGSVFGWGREGHETIAKIAERNLTKKAKKRIEKYLGGHSIVYFAKWMDEYRHPPEYKFTNNWHTVPVNAELRYEDSMLATGGNAIYGLEQAIENLKKYYKGKAFLPKAFKDGNHIEEIQGVYVPFWLFDANASGSGQYEATTSSSHRNGDYVITTTKHYDVRRAGTTQFMGVPVDGSTKMPNGHMDAIEPYDYRAFQPFSTAFLPGYMADKYDEDADTCQARAHSRMQNSVSSELSASITGYSSVSTLSENISIDYTAKHYALLPVWMLHTKWQGKDYLFAMNGQTGKLVGDLPVDKRKVAAWFAGISVPLMILLAFLL